MMLGFKNCKNGCMNVISTTADDAENETGICSDCASQRCAECDEVQRIDGTCPRCFPEKLTAEFNGYEGFWSLPVPRFSRPVATYLIRTRDGKYPHGTTMTIEQAQKEYGKVFVRFSAPPFAEWLEAKKEFEARQ